MTLEYEVSGREELAAAVLAAAQPTHELARANPVVITLLDTSCRYFFRNGIHERRADGIARRISRTPQGAFK